MGWLQGDSAPERGTGQHRFKPSEIKRLRELWIGHPDFRDRIESIPRRDLQKWGVDFNHNVLRGATFGDSPEQVVRDYVDSWDCRTREHSQEVSTGPGNHHYRSWYSRQVGRFMTQSDHFNWSRAPHVPFAIELTSGCSIGCDYCGFSASRLRGIAHFTTDNKLLFRSVLEVLAEFVGQHLEKCFLYWATEPLDNPDYEKFLDTYHQLFGVTPHTTTAAWSRDITRTQKLLAQSRQKDCASNRFSIHSLDLLCLCMTEFSPEELEDVGLVFQNPGSLSQRVMAGRGGAADENAIVGTIACVTGFLVNLVDRSVRLICPSTDLARWPLGYEILKESRFEDAVDLRGFLEDCARDVLRSELNDKTVLRLRSDFEVERNQPDRIVLKTKFSELSFDHPAECAVLKAIDGLLSVGQIVDALMDEHGAAYLYHTINQLHDSGVFD